MNPQRFRDGLLPHLQRESLITNGNYDTVVTVMDQLHADETEKERKRPADRSLLHMIQDEEELAQFQERWQRQPTRPAYGDNSQNYRSNQQKQGGRGWQPHHAQKSEPQLAKEEVSRHYLRNCPQNP